MNSTFTVIKALIKSNIGEKCLINFLMNVSSKGLKDYLSCASIYNGTWPKRKQFYWNDCLWMYDWKAK